jgi:hypothetical protein
LFSTPQGFYLGVDSFDHFINGWGLLSVGIGQVLAVGWFLGFETVSRKVGRKSAYVYAWTYWAACLTWALVSTTTGPAFRGDGWRSWYDENRSGRENGLRAVGFEAFLGFLLYFFIIVVGWTYSWKLSGLPLRTWFDILKFYGVKEFADHMKQLDSTQEEKINETYAEKFFYLSFQVLIKYFHPFILPLFLCFELRRDLDWDWPYEGYPYGYLLLSMTISTFLILFALGYGIYYSLYPERYVPGPNEITWRSVFLDS